ncbi:GNAT family N-acetyltransferase [Massilia sp. TSP1-1-2]|uniref:GNAT family N-acetyltransferase n=1 Tax=Massilia sp. TSP1-1-2 TaxID=2804649 RepID=UPI003CF4DCB5
MHKLIDTHALLLAWSRAPWDEAVCGFAVMQVDQIAVRSAAARADMQLFEQARDAAGAGLVSCRLLHDRLAESMLLEACGFRFIEMMYAPHLALAAGDVVDQASDRDADQAAGQDGALRIVRAGPADMDAILAVAASAFQHERFKMDFRLDASISDRRFHNWVANTPGHATQQLYGLYDQQRLVAFFITELQADGTCYWHLNAVAPDAQGQGYGRRAWRAMLGHARQLGAQRVRTSVAARNTRVLAMYARLGFTLPAPSMTFHWVRA